MPALIIMMLLSLLTACEHAQFVRGNDTLAVPCGDAKDRRRCLVEAIGKDTGRAVIRAVYEADGTLSDAKVVISSGNQFIDQLALEGVMKAASIKNQAHKRVIVLVPIHYLGTGTP